jgi:hypothetical protein
MWTHVPHTRRVDLVQPPSSRIQRINLADLVARHIVSAGGQREAHGTQKR